LLCAGDPPGAARAYLRRQANLLHPPMLDDALILTSELVTNAIHHGRPAVTLAVQLEPSALTVVVTDTGPAGTQYSPPGQPRRTRPRHRRRISHPLGGHAATRQPRQGRVVRPRSALAAAATRLTSQRGASRTLGAGVGRSPWPAASRAPPDNADEREVVRSHREDGFTVAACAPSERRSRTADRASSRVREPDGL
jgi:hypothetical protein